MDDFGVASIDIYGLHGRKNIRVPLESKYKIFLSENGQGKTTILKLINAIFVGDSHKLNSIIFKSIHVNLLSGNVLKLEKEDLFFEVDSRYSDIIKSRFGTAVHQKMMGIIVESSNRNIAFINIKRFFQRVS